MSYPDKNTLKSELTSKGVPNDIAERISTKFEGEKISCNHRIAQTGCFQLAKGDTDAARIAAEVLCGYVDEAQCGLGTVKGAKLHD